MTAPLPSNGTKGQTHGDEKSVTILCLDSELALEKRVRNYDDDVKYGIYFDNYSSYTIHTRPSLLPPRNQKFSNNRVCDQVKSGCADESIEHNIRNCRTALTCGVANVQFIFNTIILACVRDSRLAENCSATDLFMSQPLELVFNLFPKQEEVTAEETKGTLAVMVLTMLMSVAPFVNFVLVNVVSEKENRIKDGFRMMGMSTAAYAISWFVVYSAELFVASAIAGFILFIPIVNFFECSALFPVFITNYMLYAETSLLLSLILATFFRQAIIAGIVGSLVSVLYALMYFMTSEMEASYHPPLYPLLMLGRFSSTGAFAESFEGMIRTQRQRTCPSLTQAFLTGYRSPEGFDRHSQALYALILLADAVVFAVVLAYFEYVQSSMYEGCAKWLFCFHKSFWCQRRMTSEEAEERIRDPVTPIPGCTTDIEPPVRSRANNASIRFVALRKEFGNGETVAIQWLTFDIYGDQITCLLGHNGAGKTTVMNIMTGLTRPTHGTILINGRDVKHQQDMDVIRMNMGVCPQFDILYDYMTPAEHITMLGMMKGASKERIASEMEAMVHELDLEDHANVLVKRCSLGTKRKVSVALALSFNPTIVFLDEPTSGMDPAARRRVWDALKKYKAGKTVVLTTHFMDEADILADRKAIISRGYLLCYGSSLFLKNRFGVGYSLHIATDLQRNVPEITTVVQTGLPSAKLVRQQRQVLVYLLPLEDIAGFGAVFDLLEKEMDNPERNRVLGIHSFGISMTTLEDVFLKLAQDQESEAIVRSARPVEEIIRNKPPDHDETKEQMEALLEERAKDPLTHGGPIGQSILDFRIVLKAMENMTTAQISSRAACWALLELWFKIATRNNYILMYRVLMPIALLVAGFVLLKLMTKLSTEEDVPVWQIFEDSCRLHFDGDTPGCTPKDHSWKPCPLRDGQGTLQEDVHMSCFRAPNPRFPTPENAQLLPDSFLPPPDLSVRPSFHYNISFNDTAFYMVPFVINLLYNARFQNQCSTIMDTATCKSSNGFVEDKILSLRSNVKTSSEPVSLTVSFGLVISITMIALGLSMPGPSFAAEIVKARQKRIWVMLSLNGISPTQYWISRFTSHIMQCIPMVVLLPIMMHLFAVPELSDAGAIASTFLLVLTGVPQSILLCYLMSLAYDDGEACMATLPPLTFMMGFVPFIAPGILLMVDKQDFANFLHIAFCLADPVYINYGGLIFIAKAHMMASFKMKALTMGYYMKFEHYISLAIVMNMVHSVLLGLAIYAWTRYEGSSRRTEYLHVQPADPNEDKDVQSLRTNISKGIFHAENEPPPILALENATKHYVSEARVGANCCSAWQQRQSKPKNTVGLNQLSLTTFPGEVFGLLGPSGAGKTTTLKCITGEQRLTSGRIWLCGNDAAQKETWNQHICGYCPETDALWDDIKLAEHLQFYSYINGLDDTQRQSVVNFLLDILQIREHANKQTKNLSGGTKRKCSFAMAMLRCPRVVLLDEPSTGMDPQSKRFLWDAIMLSFSGSRGAIMTTQSMEEAEHLCDRVGILVKGVLKCVGTAGHLTQAYGTGYYLELRAAYVHEDTSEIQDEVQRRMEEGAQTEEREDVQDKVVKDSHSATVDDVVAFVQMHFPEASLLELRSDNLYFHIPKAKAPKLSYSFRVLEEAKNRAIPLIKEYSLSQTSLEQVFLHFAKEQAQNKKCSLRREASASSGGSSSQHNVTV